jgi:hypothetical protein
MVPQAGTDENKSIIEDRPVFGRPFMIRWASVASGGWAQLRTHLAADATSDYCEAL